MKVFYLPTIKNNYEDYERVVFITDDVVWIRNLINNYYPDAIHILDKFHLIEDIYDFANAVFKDNRVKIKCFADRIYEK